MSTSAIPLSTSRSSLRVVVVASSVASVMAMAAALSSSNRTTSLEEERAVSQSPPSISTVGPDFMDRIRNKPYMKDTIQRGIPQSLRLVTVDVPELRRHLTGTCAVDYRASYEDGVAPDLQLPDGRKVEQKMLAQSMYNCFKTSTRVAGVQVLETSVQRLNPNHVRRNIPVLNAVEKIKLSIEEKRNSSEKKENKKENSSPDLEEPVPATTEDEMNAPWNQYAWPDELTLRLEGRVPFGALVEKSSWVARLWGEPVYQPTIQLSKRWYEYFLPYFLCHDPAGIDGEDGTWASNMPHAIIANGRLLHRVPGSLLLLRKTCDDLGIPLYIIHDPRRWVSTNKDLNEVIHDLRHTVKANIILTATKGSGSAFSRGYYLGKMETETKYQVKEHYQSVTDKFAAFNAQLEHDWSQLGVEALEEKLKEHKAIQGNGSAKFYTNGLIALARQVLNQESLLAQPALSKKINEPNDSPVDGNDSIHETGASSE